MLSLFDAQSRRCAVGFGLFMAPMLSVQACGGSSGSPPSGAGGAAEPAAGGSSGTGGLAAVGGSLDSSGGQSTSGGSTTGGAGGLGGAESGGSTGSGGAGQHSSFPSCAGMAGDECQGGDCCDSILVPGGTVQVQGADYALPDFYLDKYEVTVARFRAFQEDAEAWQAAGHPAEGDGAHPDVPASGFRTSWLADFEDLFAVGLVPTWRNYPEDYQPSYEEYFAAGFPTYQIAGTDHLAVNFVPIHIAFAFCIWDGGRLPAVAEWMYVASGGDQPTTYVWGEAPSPEEMFATIPAPTVPNPHDDGNTMWPFMAIAVGSHPASVGRFGHHDLVSGLGEYLRDTSPDAGEELGGLIELGGDENISGLSFDLLRATIGTSWYEPGVVELTGYPTPGQAMIGIRCARDP